MARRIKALKTGPGHKPWEEYEVAQFRDTWDGCTRERVLFEEYLNTGLRSVDVAKISKAHCRDGEIYCGQTKTGEDVWIPVMDDLSVVLYPWMASLPLDEKFIMPGRAGSFISHNRVQGLMREAITAAGLPKERTLHGLRYTFAVRAVEFGVDHASIEAIVGHKTLQMAIKYTEKRRKARFVTVTMNAALKEQYARVSATRPASGEATD
jgi:integrase